MFTDNSVEEPPPCEVEIIQEVQIEDWPGTVDGVLNTYTAPVMIRGAANDWPAATWTPEFFAKNHPDAPVDVFFHYNEGYKNYTGDGDIYKFLDTKKSITLKDYYNEVFADPSIISYVNDKVIFDTHPELKEALTPPLPPEAVKHFFILFLGTQGTHTRPHTHEFHDVFLTQLYGDKLITLISPEFHEGCYSIKDNYETYPHYISPVDVLNPDLEKYPKFAEVKIHQAIMKPGDMVFIPKGWLHDVRSLSPSISISNFVETKSP